LVSPLPPLPAGEGSNRRGVAFEGVGWESAFLHFFKFSTDSNQKKPPYGFFMGFIWLDFISNIPSVQLPEGIY
jgi:hypothetical protein